MNPFSYLLSRPAFEHTPETLAAFEHLYQATSPGDFIQYGLSYPKWQYLSYLCETKNLVLHGSQKDDIEVVEPRQANDIKAFSNQKAIYATTDGIWVLYFAIIDRKNYPGMSLFNSCFHLRISPDQLSEPVYFFSITQSVLLQKPWCEGVIYILPRQSFVQEASQLVQGVDIVFPHWISPLPAEPVAKLRVQPHDFPFLSQVHGHNDERLNQLASAQPDGFPWPEALES